MRSSKQDLSDLRIKLAPMFTKHAAIGNEEAFMALGQLQQIVSACTECPVLCEERTQTVFGVGTPSPRLVLVGEAPGFHEDQQGEPFVGDAGQLLNRILAAIELKREDVYICNVLKCRPPQNRKPLPSEVAACIGYLELQLDILQPELICCLGATAASALLGKPQPMNALRGRFYEYRGIPLMVTYHPAYLLRNPNAKREVWQDMQECKRLLDRLPQGISL